MKSKSVLICSLMVALCCLFSACDDIFDTPETSVDAGYGKISIGFTGEDSAYQDAARTVMPSTAFSKYVYTFTKAGATSGVVKTPDSEGYFTLEIGAYTVKVEAYIGNEGSYTLAASGASSEFSVGSGGNVKVEVPLSSAAAGTKGEFAYTVTWPANAAGEITLKKWPALNDIALNPVNVSQGNGKTQTLQLETGSYLLTVLVSKNDLYAGTNEAIHIYPALSTEYKKDFADTDLLAPAPITSAEFIITAPVKNVTPNTTVSSSGNSASGNFTTGPVSWSPAHSPFQGGTAYTATVTLTANIRRTFNGLNTATINGLPATVSGNTGKSVTLSYTFPETDPDTVTVTVTGITIKNQPTNLDYTHGDKLDLAGLVVALAYDDGTKEDVAAGSFAAKNITANPSQGNNLVHLTHDKKSVKITYGNLTANTDNLTVNPKRITFAVDPIPAETYTGNPITPPIMVKDGPVPLTQPAVYTVTYANNINAGTAIVTVIGAGNYAGSSGRAEFTIKPKVIMFDVATIPVQTYTGGQIRPAVTVRDDTLVRDDKTLKQPADYTVAYTDNINVGTAYVTITGAGNYAGSSGETTFRIVSVTVDVAVIVTAPVKGEEPRKTARGSDNFTVDDVSWSPNHNPFQSDTSYTVTLRLTAKANYSFTGLSVATINGYEAEISNKTDKSVTLSYKFQSTEASVTFKESRFVAVPNTIAGKSIGIIKYAYTYNGFDYYYFHLGKLYNVPLYYHGDSFRVRHNTTSRTYEFETTTSTEQRFSEIVTTTREETVSISTEHTVSTETEIKFGQEISTEVDLMGIAKIGGKYTAEERFNRLVSNSINNGFQVTTSLSNTVEQGKSWLTANRTSVSFTFTNADREGYYRYTCFAVSDMYLYVVRDQRTKEIYYEFREHIVPDTESWDLDYTEELPFGKTDATKFGIDISDLKDLKSPLELTGIQGKDFSDNIVTNTDEWKAALTAIENGGNGTAVNPKTYTIVVHGDVTVPPSTFGSLQHVEVTLMGNGKLNLGANGSMLYVGNNQKLIIDDPRLTLQGRTDNTMSLLYVDSGGKLELKNGTITGNKNTSRSGGGGVTAIGGSTFVMTGGTISGNSGQAAGVRVQGSSFTMSGGTISNNYGSGVNIVAGTFTMKGGTIEGNKFNTAYSGGGGVSVMEGGKFTMEGGTIKGNEATFVDNNYAISGGVLIHSNQGSTFTKKDGGIIYGNNGMPVQNKVNGSDYGHAVLYHFGAVKYRNNDLLVKDDISTEIPNIGWEN